MSNKLNLKDLWDDLKNTDDVKELETVNVAETISNLITEFSKARKAKNYTQRDLARVSGIKQSAIARFESAQVIPRLDTIAKLAFYLDIKLKTDYLLQSKEKQQQTIVYIVDKYYNRSAKSKDPVIFYDNYKNDYEEYCVA